MTIWKQQRERSEHRQSQLCCVRNSTATYLREQYLSERATSRSGWAPSRCREGEWVGAHPYEGGGRVVGKNEHESSLFGCCYTPGIIRNWPWDLSQTHWPKGGNDQKIQFIWIKLLRRQGVRGGLTAWWTHTIHSKAFRPPPFTPLLRRNI